VSHDYIWSGDRLLAEVTDDYILKFFYDASGNVLGFEYLTPTTDASGNTDYTGTTYYYEKNIFGDVVAIYDENGTKVGAYGFNSYGQNNVVTNLTDDDIASLNPIRYRSYYYDTDIYLYYLQSRYYDPVTCRFINCDNYLNANGDIIGFNLFAYCSNNPVMNTDPTGKSVLAICLFIGISAVIGGLSGAFVSACTGGNVVEGAIEGAILGGVAATVTVFMPYLIPMIMPTATTAATTAISTVASFAICGALGLAVDYITQNISHEISKTENEEFDLDEQRLLKTGLTTGVAGIVPTLGLPGDSVTNSIFSLFMGFDVTVIVSALDVILTTIFG